MGEYHMNLVQAVSFPLAAALALMPALARRRGGEPGLTYTRRAYIAGHASAMDWFRQRYNLVPDSPQD